MLLLFRQLRGKNIVQLIAMLCFIVIQVIGTVYLPWFMSNITALIQTPNVAIGDVIAEGLWMLGCSLIIVASAILSFTMSTGVAADLTYRLRNALFEKIMRFSLKETGEFGTSSLITRCTADITTIEMFLDTCLVPIIQCPLLGAAIIIRICNMDFRWTITTAAVLAVMILILFIIILRVMTPMRRLQKINDQMTRVNREHLSGIRVIHAYNGYDHQEKRFTESNTEYTKTYIRMNNRIAFLMPTVMSLYCAMNILIYMIGAFLVAFPETGDAVRIYADMVSFSSYAGQLIMAVISLILVFVMLPRSLTSLLRIKEVLYHKNSIVDAEQPAVGSETGTIEFRNVSFRYPNAKADALTDINFTAQKGQTIAIIGATGSGKTSLLNLIPRMYDTSSGEVLVDGLNVKNYTLDQLRNRIGYVPQKSYLFRGSIQENIGYGDNGRFEASIHDISEAAKIGQADEFIQKKESGYQSRVEQGGGNFSGGQKQRLTISRAICRDPEIFLFDDSFSALDFKTDKILRHKLREAAGDATMFIVAQRVGTIRNADKILVLDQGKLCGVGTHDELIHNCPVYREIALSQLSAKEAGLA